MLDFFRLSVADCGWLAYWIAISIPIVRSWDHRQHGAMLFLVQGFLVALVTTRVISNWVRIAYSLLCRGSALVIGGSSQRERVDVKQVRPWLGLTLFTHFLYQGILVSLLIYPFAAYLPEFSWWFLALLYISCCQVDMELGSWRRYVQYTGYAMLFVLGVLAAFSANVSVMGLTDVFTKSVAMSTSEMVKDYPFAVEKVEPPMIQALLGFFAAIVAIISFLMTQLCRSIRWKIIGFCSWGAALIGTVVFFHWNKSTGVLLLGPFMAEGSARFDWELRGFRFSENRFIDWIVGPKEFLVLGLLAAIVLVNALHSKDSIELHFKTTAKRRLADFNFIVWLLLTFWMMWCCGAYFFIIRAAASSFQYRPTPFFQYWPTLLLPIVMWQIAWRQLPGWKTVFFPRHLWISKSLTIRMSTFHPVYYPLTILMLLISVPLIAYCIHWFLIYLSFAVFRGG